jgi:iron complex transport system ATP-binding protein
LRSTNLEIAQGTLVALIGANGSGKTSLLRALAGVEIEGGCVVIDDEDLASASPARRPQLLTFLPASREMVWPIRVRDLIALGLAKDDPARIEWLLGQLQLGPLSERPSTELSTGERARVLLARALAPAPRLLLLDEPLSNLDPYWVLRTLELLRHAVDATGCAAIVSLHDIDRMGAFDRVLLVDHGLIIADHVPKDMLASTELERSFRIQRSESGWQVA